MIPAAFTSLRDSAERFVAPIAGVTTGQSAATTTIQLVLVLLIAATILAVVAGRFGIPYPVLLVLGGLGLGFIPAREPDAAADRRLLRVPALLCARNHGWIGQGLTDLPDTTLAPVTLPD